MTKKLYKNNLLSLVYMGGVVIFFMSVQMDAATMAYWRFEEGTADTLVDRDGNPNGVYYPAVLDSSGNGYDLSAWSGEVIPDDEWAQEYYRTAVPVATIPLTGATNTLCLQNAGNAPGMFTNDEVLKNWKPLTWTVEAYIQTNILNQWRAAVGRDGDDIDGDNPAFRIQMTDYSAIRVSFCDLANTYHQAETGADFMQTGQWYHVAATSDGSTLRLYVDGVEMASTGLATADTRLSDGSNGRDLSGGEDEGKWSVFRAMWDGNHADRWSGYIDEVRISDVALPPSQFLNSPSSGYVSNPQYQQIWPELGGSAAFSVAIAAPVGETVANVQWYKKAAEVDPGTLIVDDNIKYDIEWSQDDSALIIYDTGMADALLYYATVTFSDTSVLESDSASLIVSSGLVHRWSFSGNLQDSVGAADGTLYDPSGLASYVDGSTQLLLDNDPVYPNDSPNNITYVNLPDGIVSTLGNYMTIELWYTPHRINGSWTSLYGFGLDGNGDPSVFNGGQGVLLQQQVVSSGPGFTYEAGGATRWTSPTVPALDEEIMVTMVWDGNAGMGRFYVNDVEIDSGILPGTLSAINDVDNILGAAWWNDPMVNASFNEMRIYDTPLPAEYISDHYAIGPDLLEPVAGVIVTPLDLTVLEEGSTSGDLFFSLEYEPAGTVVLTVTEQDARGQVTLDQATLTFTTGNWSTPQPIHVTAVDDTAPENAKHAVPLAIAVSSGQDPNYDGLAVEPVAVYVADNECGAWGYPAGDFNQDCVVDFYDFATFAKYWMDCSDPDQVDCTDFRGM